LLIVIKSRAVKVCDSSHKSSFNESIVESIDVTCRHVVCSFEQWWLIIIHWRRRVVSSSQQQSRLRRCCPEVACTLASIASTPIHCDSENHNELPTHERLLFQRSEIAATDSMSLDASLLLTELTNETRGINIATVINSAPHPLHKVKDVAACDVARVRLARVDSISLWNQQTSWWNRDKGPDLVSVIPSISRRTSIGREMPATFVRTKIEQVLIDF